jgi:hypothetical protein
MGSFLKMCRALVALYTVCGLAATAQTQTLMLSGQSVVDAAVHRDTRPGQEAKANTNYGDFTKLSAVAWTNSSKQIYWRTFLYFNIDAIPPGSTIQSATLFLYSDPAFSASNSADGNSQLSGSNAIYLERVTAPWHETTVTWNNQPTTTTTDRLWVGASSSTTENRQINLTSMIQGWVNDPLSNHGLRMQLESEVYYRSRNYASSDHSNSALRPRLEILYTLPATIAPLACETPDPTESELMAMPWYGNENFLLNFNDSLNAIYSNAGGRAAGGVADAWLRIPVRFWVYQISSTNPGGNPLFFPTEESFQLLLDDLNGAFRDNGVKLQFYLDNVQFANDDRGINPNGVMRTTLSYIYHNTNRLNVHIVDDMDAGGIYNPINNNSIFIIRNLGIDETGAKTFTHEVGHFFSLFHTHLFFNVPCLQEPVTRDRKITPCPNGLGYTKRCNYTGDLLCDTDADPNMGIYGTITDCTYSGSRKDQNGDTYHPDAQNYMGEGNWGCEETFTNGQRNVIHFRAFSGQFRAAYLKDENNRFDTYEPDDAAIAARPIAVGETQSHTFHASGRFDNVDWLRFQHPATGASNNYQLVVTQTDAGAVATPLIFLQDAAQPNGVSAPLTGITSTTAGNTITYTIPCGQLTRGATYLVQLTRGGGTDTRDYDVQLRLQSGALQSIVGPDNLCNGSTATYTVSGLMAGQTVMWTSTNAAILINATTGVATVASGTTSTSTTINATITNACGNLSKTVTAGVPSANINTLIYPNGQRGVDPVSLCGGCQYTFFVDPVIGASSYTWVLPPGFSFTSGSTTAYPGIRTSTIAGSYTLYCSANNSCGSRWTNDLFIVIGSGGGGIEQRIAVYPNPTSEELVVEASPTEEGVTTSLSESDFSATVRNELNKDVKSEKSKNGKIRIDLRDLPEGFYVLNVETKDGVFTRHILIKR